MDIKNGILLCVIALLLICASIEMTSAKTRYTDDEGRQNFKWNQDVESAGDAGIVYLPAAYAGKDIITLVGFPTQFIGYGTSPIDYIIRYEWDFDGDGRFDWHSNLTGQTYHTYNATGTYYAKLRVYDDNNITSIDSVKVIVKSDIAPYKYAELVSPRSVPAPPEKADGIRNSYVVMINGGNEPRFWDDVTFMYSTLISDYNFTADNIYLFNYNGKSPDGKNPNNMIDYSARKSNISSVFSELTGIIDSDDLLFVWVTDHGRGYNGPGTTHYGYLDGFASVDPGDEHDYLESDFKLRSFCTGGNYYCNHGMEVWKVYYKWFSSYGCYSMYRNKYVSRFTDVYFEGSNTTVSNNDIFIERFVDYLLGDADRDGYIETNEGEVYDYDGDGNPPYNHATETFDEDDWGDVDYYKRYSNVNTGVPEGRYIIFDYNFDNHVDIDLNTSYDCIYYPENCNIDELEVDGTDLDNQGLFDGLDVNGDGDKNDWVSIDEKIDLYSCSDLLDDEMAIYLAPINACIIPIFMEQCFSGGFIEDLSATNRVILTATVEEDVSWGNVFVGHVTSAFHGATRTGMPVDADDNGNGHISFVEAFNYASKKDSTEEIPQYDDNGDKIGHAYPIPHGSDGDLGAVTYLEWNVIPPVASFSYTPETPMVNQKMTFNASASYDPDGNLANYEWDFGDGHITNITEETITHFYLLDGDHNVSLTVTDDEGATDTTVKTIPILEKLVGNLDGDGEITSVDAVIALRITVDNRSCDATMLTAADVSDDNQVTALDALMILQAAAGTINL
jgi:hypothetical protein